MKKLICLSVLVLALVSAAPALGSTPTIAAGGYHTCATNDAGAVFCWGENTLGELGNGSTDPTFVPLPVKGLPAAAASVGVGNQSSCALLVDGTVWCWGSNAQGQLGSGATDTNPHAVPTKVPSLSDIAQLSVGTYTNCALAAGGTARCWGSNGSGEVGNSLASDPQTTPIPLQGLTGLVRQISAGYYHSCAVLTDGTGRCWGYNSGGILGNDSETASPIPVTVQNLAGAAGMYTSGYTSCAFLASGGASCWGYSGLLGNGPSGSKTPVAVSDVSGVSAMGGSNSVNCAVTAGGLLKCWGNAPGNGQTTHSDLPTPVIGGTDVLAISGNGYGGHTCFVVRGGTANCWGTGNSKGELGNGSSSPSEFPTPGPVVNLDLVIGVYAPPAVSFKAGKAKTDKKRKTYSLPATVRATVPPLLAPAGSCSGAIAGKTTYTYKKAKRKKKIKKTVKAKGTLSPSGYDCVAKLNFKLPVKYLSQKKVTLSAAFAGNGSLGAFSAKSAKIKLPKVKKKK